MSTSWGAGLLRFEDHMLLKGRGEFIGDIRRAGMLSAAFIRSPHAHARIVHIESMAATSFPGVELVETGQTLSLDITPPLGGPHTISVPRPVLAREVVRFVGEPLAVVVASDRYTAEDAAEGIDVDFDPLPALVDPFLAAQVGSVRLHALHSNVLMEDSVDSGNVDQLLGAADIVVEASFRTNRCAAAPIEPRGATAWFESGQLVMYSSTQAPHILRNLLASTFRLDLSGVRVICPDIGGGFGQKAHSYPEEVVVAALAMKLGRPVQWLEDRSENLAAASHARDQWIRARCGADRDGHLLAIDLDLVSDVGAYGVYPHGYALECLGTPSMVPGPYKLQGFRSRARAVATNKCPEGAYRGVGLPVSTLVHERLIDCVANRLGLDRVEVRRRNLIQSAELPYRSLTGHVYDSGDYSLALERAAQAIEYEGLKTSQTHDQRLSERLGVGFALYVEYSGMGSNVFKGRGMLGIPGIDSAHLAVEGDGSISVWTSLPSIGQGTATTFAQVTASVLGLNPKDVHVHNTDTAVAHVDGTGTFASRSAVVGGGAVVLAARELRQRLLDDAAAFLEAAPEDIEIVSGALAVVGTDRSISLSQLASNAPDRYRTMASYDPPRTAYPYAAHACVVAVDTETGGVRIIRYVVVEDCGRVINPMIVEGQSHGAIVQGIGEALLESMLYDDIGQLKTSSFMDYLCPGPEELPEMQIDHVISPAPDSPTAAKGVGEGGTVGAPAAVANAIANALRDDTVANVLPITPEAIVMALREKAG
jgi:aerobic carbon-monoxide dehydrogenase large subunit